jgi:methionyl-tRNA formyltransferase
MKIAILCNDRLGFPALQHLIQQQSVVAIGTSDRIGETALFLKKLSDSAKIPFRIFQKNNLESELTLWLEIHQPDVVFVKTFPWKIPATVLSIPKFGFINFHYAPLPAFRGPNPLFWMIRNQEPTGGVTVHQMDENLDTGDVLITKEIHIYPEASFGMLIGQLAHTGLEATIPLVQALTNETLKPEKQNTANSKWYNKPKQEDLFIDWKTMTSWEVRAIIKACNPWQKGAATRYKSWTFGITDASLSFTAVTTETIPGTIIGLDESSGLIIACADKKAIKIEVVYSEEGYFPGYKMIQFGLRKGDKLDSKSND